MLAHGLIVNLSWTDEGGLHSASAEKFFGEFSYGALPYSNRDLVFAQMDDKRNYPCGFSY